VTALADFTAPARSFNQRLRTNTNQPTIATTGNLRLTRCGSWWADWIVDGYEFGLRDVSHKLQVKASHQKLYRHLPDYSLLGGFSAPMDIGDIMRRSINQNAFDAGGDYVDECNGQAHRMERLGPRKRIFWLSIPLDNKFRNASLLSDLSGDYEPSAEEIDEAAAKAEAFETAVQSIARLNRVTGRQMRWLWDHHISRGLDAGPCPPAVEGRIRSGMRSFTQAFFDEGANGDRPRTGWFSRRLPSFSRIVKISQPEEDDPRESYQQLLHVKSFSTDEMIFPGGTEFLTLADTITGTGRDGVVDWVMRVRKVPRQQVLAKTVKTLRQIDEQMDQRDGETSFGLTSLGEKARILADYNYQMERSDSEFEVRFTPIFAVGAPTPEQTKSAVQELKSACSDLSIALASPLGSGRELFMSMVPGAHHTRAVDTCVQITTSADAAAFVPFTSATVGDRTGPIVGINLSSGGFEPIHLDVVSKTARKQPASIAAVGYPGGGKTYFLQTVSGQCVDQNGQVLVTDRTEIGEYANWAYGLTPNPTIVDPFERKFSMDPLRTFDRYEAADRTLDFLLPLINVGATSPVAARLRELLHPESRDLHAIHSLAELTSYLNSSDLPEKYLTQEIRDVADLLQFWANNQNADFLFNKSLPALELTSDITVIRTHRLELPEKEEIEKPHLFKDITPTKHMGRAIYGLSATIARRAFYGHGPDSRFGAYVTDEAYHIVGTRSGVVKEFARDGRKHNCAIFLGSQSPDDFGTLTEFFATLVTFRQPGELLAKKSIEFIGLKSEANEDIVNELMFDTSPPGLNNEPPEEHRRGEGYITDRRNVARFKVLGPALQSRHTAMDNSVEYAA